MTQSADSKQTPDPQSSNEPQPSTEPQDGPQPQDSGDAASQRRGLYGSGLRYTQEDADNGRVPQWAVGKTADEMVKMTQGLVSSMGQPQPQQAPSASQSPQVPSTPANGGRPMQQYGQPQQNAGPQLPDPDLMYSDPAEYQRQWNAYQQFQTAQTVQQASAPFLQSQAQIARDASKRDPERSDVWDSYEPEIMAEMQKLPPQQKASVDAWNLAVDLVAGRHRRELAQQEAQKLAANRDTGTVSANDPAPDPTAGGSRDAIDELFANDHPAIQRYKDNGISKDRVKKQATHMGRSIDEYAELLKKNATVHG